MVVSSGMSSDLAIAFVESQVFQVTMASQIDGKAMQGDSGDSVGELSLAFLALLFFAAIGGLWSFSLLLGYLVP